MTNYGDIWAHWIRAASTTANATTTIQDQIWTIWNHANATVTTYPMVVHAQDRDRENAEWILARGRVSPEERARREAQERLRQEEEAKRIAV